MTRGFSRFVRVLTVVSLGRNCWLRAPRPLTSRSLTMPSEFDIHYALGQTRVLHEPDRRIDTFGSTQFEFQIVSELMDSINTCRVRNGRIEAHKPIILKPEVGADFDFEGFGPQGSAFGEWLRENAHNMALRL
jgi:hypothetical protein